MKTKASQSTDLVTHGTIQNNGVASRRVDTRTEYTHSSASCLISSTNPVATLAASATVAAKTEPRETVAERRSPDVVARRGFISS